MIKIWEKYLIKEILKSFALALFIFYFIYVIIDYSTHIQDFFAGGSLHISKICAYYGYQFIKRSDILLPLSLLLATLKVFLTMNQHRELLAFLTSGLTIKQLSTPVLCIGFSCTLLYFAIEEYLLPHSLNFIDRFYSSHLSHSARDGNKGAISVLYLQDHSKLIFQHYDPVKEAFFDVIWVRNSRDIWRIKYLNADPSYPLGKFVDHIEYQSDGSFSKTESFNSLLIKELKWQKDLPKHGLVPFENRPISQLHRLTFTPPPALSLHQICEIRSQLAFKWIIPFLSLMAVMAVIPFCTSYSRQLPIFMIFAIAIFGLLAFYVFIDATVILARNDILSPLWAIIFPFTLFFSYFSYRFLRIR